MPFGRQRLLPGPGPCPRSSAGALKTDIDSEGALRAFAVVHAGGQRNGPGGVWFFCWFLYLTSDGICV